MTTDSDAPRTDEPRASESPAPRRSPVLVAVAALALVALGVAGGVAVGYALDDGGSAGNNAAPLSRMAEVASPGDTGTTSTTGEPSPPYLELIARVPASERPCTQADPSSGETAVVVCDSPAGVTTVYSKFGSTASLRREYGSILADLGVSEGQTPDRCPVAVPGEQSLTTGDLTTGRLVCYEHEGSQWIAWTSEPLNVLAAAKAAEGMSATKLFEWWQETQRPILADAEAAFYGRVPESHRADCEFRFVAFSPVMAVPPPDHGSSADCYLPSPKSPNNPLRRIIVLYTEYYTAERMNQVYENLKSDAGTTPDTGDCKTNPPAEGSWEQNGKTVGRFACTGKPLAHMWWTTDPVKIVSSAIAPQEMTLSELWDWWANESGPTYRGG